MRKILLFLVSVVSLCSFAQKKVIDYKAYADWKVIKEFSLSENQKYFSFTTEPYEGNKKVYLVSIDEKVDTLLQLDRGSSGKFNKATTFFTSTISADYAKVRQLKIKETKAHKMPKDTLVIFDLVTKKKVIFPNVETYEVLDSTDMVVGLFAHNYKVKDAQLSKGKEAKLKEGYDGETKTFFVADNTGQIVYQEQGITQFYLDREQQAVVLVKEDSKKGKTFYKIANLNLKTLKTKTLGQQFEKIENVFLSTKKQTNYLIGKLFNAKQQRNEWYRISADFLVLDSMCLGHLLDSTFVISSSSKFVEVPNSNKWQIQLTRFEPKKGKDTLLKEEKVQLDIWSSKDNLIQPKQLKDYKKYYTEKLTAIVDFDQYGFVEKITPIENDTFEIQEPFKYASFTIGTSSFPYNPTISFDYPWKEDVYLVNLISGEKTKLLSENYSPVLLSPTATHLFFLQPKDTNLYVRNLSTKQENCITCSLTERWLEDLNGMDYLPSSDGKMLLDANQKDVWFNSTKALYRYDVKENKLIRITPNDWLNRNIKLNFTKINADSAYFNASNIIVEEQDLDTKINTYYAINENLELNKILTGYFSAMSFLKTIDGFLARIQNNENYPNFYLIKNGNYQAISDVNPQQKEYNWSKVEPVKWKSYSGIALEGLLYKPENFDSTKTYPLIVYYYETSSEDIHRYVAPRPTASIIFSTEYASSGYFVFMPDIRYQIGHPAQGAYDAIMSGTDYVLKRYQQIDSTRMGLQGQSWGGYQTAQLITMTTRYAAAMAGAPVSNMFSAYGGIRWGTGLSRQFQYEHSQSRIGKTIWEAPELYIENSPLFGLPKVKTPLLIMHNDEDGAVPWYQGIELFMGLNRLQKPVWLLNYNGDDHNLMKKGNRKDLSRRMKEFFDFYLNKGTEPDWMKNGRPATEKK